MISLKGYIFSRPFIGERVPQHVQNIVNKDYCKKKSINFFMSATEYSAEDSSYILFELLESLDQYDGLLFYSLLQLPKDNLTRSKVLKKILSKKKQIHFAVENIQVKSLKNIKFLEQIFKIKLLEHHKKNLKFVLGKEKNYVNFRHSKSKRNYLDRMINNKVSCINIAKKYNYDYWDGDRKFGYGGYKYIPNYFTNLAKNLIKDYKLHSGSKILDVGCGKGYLVYELSKLLKNKNVYGCDLSRYALKNCKKEVKKKLFFYDARRKFKYTNNHFDFVFSNTTLHNFKLRELFLSLSEIDRIGINKYICVESYRNNKEQFNVQCWALTAETLVDKDSWVWMFEQSKYSGDYEFLYFK